MSNSDPTPPRALVVYESMFGNSQKISGAIRDGLRQTIATELVRVGEAPVAISDDVRLLVVGGPTHELGMSRTIHPGAGRHSGRSGDAR